jgi:hypothetical protein
MESDSNSVANENHHSNDYYNDLVLQLEKIKYVRVNGKPYEINESLITEMDWLNNTCNFTKTFVTYTHSINENPIEEYMDQNINYTTYPMNATPADSTIPNELITHTKNPISENVHIHNNYPFLKYKSHILNRYKTLISVLKGLYANSIQLPDIEKINKTITHDFAVNILYLKNPEFIFDDYIYHVYNHNKINNSINTITQVIKTFEYLYYKLQNYVQELEFDIEQERDR